MKNIVQFYVILAARIDFISSKDNSKNVGIVFLSIFGYKLDDTRSNYLWYTILLVWLLGA